MRFIETEFMGSVNMWVAYIAEVHYLGIGFIWYLLSQPVKIQSKKCVQDHISFVAQNYPQHIGVVQVSFLKRSLEMKIMLTTLLRNVSCHKAHIYILASSLEMHFFCVVLVGDHQFPFFYVRNQYRQSFSKSQNVKQGSYVTFSMHTARTRSPKGLL